MRRDWKIEFGGDDYVLVRLGKTLEPAGDDENDYSSPALKNNENKTAPYIWHWWCHI